MIDKELFWTIVATMLVVYLFVNVAVSQIDREHCEAHGLAYHSTSLTLKGYCRAQGIKVPAEWVGND